MTNLAMKILIGFLYIFMPLGCTYNVSMVHSTGYSQDAIDDNAAPDIKTQVTVPTSLIP